MIYTQDLGDRLVQEVQQAQKRILLIAPFIKDAVVERLFTAVDTSVPIHIVTRWTVHDVAMGASDPEIWERVRDREDTTMGLVTHLHAKYYEFDGRHYIGSANLTQKALGWAQPSNVELLVSRETFSETAISSMREGEIHVTERLYRQFLMRVEQAEIDRPHEKEFEPEHVGSTVAESPSTYGAPRFWVPQTRQPSLLYHAYSGELDELTQAARTQTQEDLRFFEVPASLSRSAFEAEIAWQLYQKPVVQRINEFTRPSRRFGAVRDHLKSLPCADRPDFNATRTWQTLIRWLLYFIPEHYEMYTANYSEIFQHVPEM